VFVVVIVAALLSITNPGRTVAVQKRVDHTGGTGCPNTEPKSYDEDGRTASPRWRGRGLGG
jgi:hypothetical protein